jgi:hypothetical protein
MSIGHVRESHKPSNKLCPHNRDCIFDCTCPSNIVRNRKPYRLVRVILRPEFVESHRLNRKVSVMVHRDGLLQFRENGRRKVYETNVGRVYQGCVWREAMLAAQAAAKKRKEKKQPRKRRR